MPLHAQSLQFINNCLSGHNAYDHLLELCRAPHRLAGTPQEQAALQHVSNRMSQWGYNSQVQSFAFPGWRMGDSSVSMAEGNTTLPSFPLGWSPDQEITAQLADAGMGTAKEFSSLTISGKVVLVCEANPPGEDLHRSDKYQLAVEHGAKGFLLYHPQPGGLVPMGTISLDNRPGAIPAAGISYESAHLLKRCLPAAVRVKTTSQALNMTSGNAIARHQQATEDYVLVGAHIDTWNCPGAYDNGSGVAMVMELARLLRDMEAARHIRFAAFGGEELGLFGSYHLAGQTPLPRVVFNLDVSAIKDGKQQVFLQQPGPFSDWITKLLQSLHLPLSLETRLVKHSDHWPFCQQGRPAFWLLSGNQKYNFAHTIYDTPDKLTPQAFTLPLLATGVCLIETAMHASIGAGKAQ